MAKENEFTKILQNSVEDGVLDRRTELEQQRDELIKKIADLESNVVKDPRELAKLKKELEKVNEQLKKEQFEKNVEEGNLVSEDVQEDKDKTPEEEKTEEIKDEKDLSQEEKEKLSEEKAQALQAYHDAMIAYYEKRISILRDQNQNGKLVSDIDDYNEELELEAKMYATRSVYMEFGEDDPYEEKRLELQKQEKKARDGIDNQLNERAASYRNLEEKLKKLSQREQELTEQLTSAEGKDIDAIQKDIDEIRAQKSNIEKEVIKVKTDLGDAIDELTRRDRQREGGLEAQKYEMMKKKELDNYSYLKDNIGRRNNNYNQAKKMEHKQLKKNIEKRELNRKIIKEKLEKTPTDNYEERLKLLKQLDQESFELEKDRRAMHDIDLGVELSEVKAQQEAAKNSKARTENDEEFDKATESLREAAKKKNKLEGEKNVENASIDGIITEENKSTNKAIAAGVALSIDGISPGPDGIVTDYIQYKVVEGALNQESKVADPPIPGMKGLTKPLDGPEAEKNAKEYIELDEKLKAQAEQEKVIQSVEKETGVV